MKKKAIAVLLLLVFPFYGLLAQPYPSTLEVKYMDNSWGFPAEATTSVSLLSVENEYPRYFVDALSSFYHLYFNGTQWVFVKTSTAGANATTICTNPSTATSPPTSGWSGCISVLVSGTETCTPPTLALTTTPSGGSWTLSASIGSGTGTIETVKWMPGNLTGNTITVSPPTTTNYTATANITGSCLTPVHPSLGYPNQISQNIDVVITNTSIISNAGEDAVNIPGTVYNLQANQPQSGQTGQWTIISGLGGNITDVHNQASSFTGIRGSIYQLRWTISDGTQSSSDDMYVLFAIVADAGEDQLSGTVCGRITLAGNDPPATPNGYGYWTVESASVANTRPYFFNPRKKDTDFFGADGVVYVLRWTLRDYTLLGGQVESYDEIQVKYVSEPSYAAAGNDQVGTALCGQNSIILAANSPYHQNEAGKWSIVSGIGGTLSDNTSPTSSFTGLTGNSYTLKWTMSKPPCLAVEDEVEIYFNAPVSLAVGGDEGSAYTGYQEAIILNSECRMIAKVNGGQQYDYSPSMSAKVVLDPIVNSFERQPYIQRHFDISPDYLPEPEAYPAVVTLYVSQSDFTNFNSASTVKLPINATDAENYKTNLRIWQWHGTPTTSPSSPGNYTGSMATPIDPVDTDIKWDAALSAWEIKFNVVGFSGFFITTEGATALPVTLLNFKAKKQENAVALTWQTTEETNSDRFEIEHSVNSKQWVNIGSVVSHRESNSLQNYTHTHLTPVTGENLYRLRMIDRATDRQDGSFAYSRIVSVKMDARSDISLYPNPGYENVTVTSKIPVSAYKLVSATGQIIKEKQEQNQSLIHVPLAKVPPGIYVMQLSLQNGQVEYRKLVVQ